MRSGPFLGNTSRFFVRQFGSVLTDETVLKRQFQNCSGSSVKLAWGCRSSPELGLPIQKGPYGFGPAGWLLDCLGPDGLESDGFGLCELGPDG